MGSDLTGWHWVLIETGSNQRYVFASNRRRQNVGASRLVANVGTVWLDEALHEHEQSEDGPHGEHVCLEAVIKASGKVLLVVKDIDCGRDVVQRVTTKALDRAPGLGVWGAVDRDAISGNPHTDSKGCACVGCRLSAVHAEFAEVRAQSDHPASRFPSTPFNEPCSHTGLPCSDLRTLGPTNAEPVSAVYAAAFDAGPDALTDLADVIEESEGEETGAKGSVRRFTDTANPRLDPVLNDGWVALLHADGNGVGNIFIQLGKIRSDDMIGLQRGLAEGLDTVMREALQDTAEHICENFPVKGGEPRREGWLLPIVLGGDDLTVILDGRIALEFSTKLIRTFAQKAKGDARIQEAVKAALGERDGGSPVSLSAGIVFIKPHHPFSDAYDLAEQLCASAKTLAKERPEALGTLDFHVLYDSVGRDLAAIRSSRWSRWSRSTDGEEGPLRLWCGPLEVDHDTSRADSASTTILFSAIETFRREKETQDEPSRKALSRTSAHAIRTGLTHGGAHLEQERERAVLRAVNSTEAEGVFDRYVLVDDPFAGTKERMTYLIDALALAEVGGSDA